LSIDADASLALSAMSPSTVQPRFPSLTRSWRSLRPPLFRPAGLYATAVASKNGGVSPGAPASRSAKHDLSPAGDDPWRKKTKRNFTESN